MSTSERFSLRMSMEAQRSHVPIWLAVCLILLGLSSVVSAEWQGDLSSYHIASFSNPHPPPPPGLPQDATKNKNAQFNHFTLSGPDGAVYVGAVNYLYRLESSFNLLQNVSTCEELGSDTCHSFTNYNKILILDNQNRLITCGSQNGGRCKFRNPDDLTDVLFHPEPNVAGFGELSTVSLIAPGTDGPTGPGPDGGDWLYVAVTYANEDVYRGIPPVSRRILSTDGLLISPSGTVFSSFTTFVLPPAQSPLHITYVAGFSYDGFTYFLASQQEDLGSNVTVSKINRVCQTSPTVESYTEITIQCQGSDGNVYSLVQAAHIGPAGHDLAVSLGLNDEDMVLYAVFAKNEEANGTSDVPIDESALCVYKMSDILDAFREAVKGCIQNGDDYSVQYLAGSKCNMFSVGPDMFLCHPFEGDTQVYKNAKGIDITTSNAVLELSATLMSSIITTTEMTHTVAIIGTNSSGELLKVHIQNKTSARLYERVHLNISRSVLKDVKINDTTREMYILTEQKFLKMRVENCGQYTTCETCIGTDAGRDGDPYCGWCTLQRQCTLHSDCNMADVSTRWLAYNTAQCIEITNVAPYDSLPSTVTEQQITVSVQQLPDLLTDMSYECWFGSYVSQATKTNEDLRCVSPPDGMIPPIQQGDDAVAVTLSINSRETSVSFVDTSFYFYECSALTSCVSCVGSRWACDWRVFENRCTHVSYTCTGANEIIITGQNNPNSSSSKGPGFCPQLLAQNTEVLLPNGIEKSLQVMTINLPNETQTTSFECSFDIEGIRQSTTAQRNADTIVCDMKAYTYTSTDEAELIVKLTIEWTDTASNRHTLDDIYNNSATLYKCGVLKPDCSRCVTARPELECVWCNAMCELRESCTTAEGEWVTYNNSANCPDPILKGIYPLTGPIEGNTIVSVMGTDIGRGFHTVLNVTIGDQECYLDGLEAYYATGYSVSCRTQSRVESVVSASLTILGGDGSTQQKSSGEVKFEYRVPSITSFSPHFGPAAGGTRITINGTALNTGRNIEAFIGDKACIITSPVTEREAVCTSAEGKVGQKEILKMSFDGADKTSQNYTFTNNPNITKVSPTSSIYAGGRELTVRGKYLNTTQMASIVITVTKQITKRSVGSNGPKNVKFVESCAREGSEFMRCRTPNITSAINSSLSQRNVTFGFIMDGVIDLLTWSEDKVDLEFFLDPVYEEFENDLYEKMEELMTIKGERINSAITASEIIVYVGAMRCHVTFIEETTLGCILPEEQPSSGDFKGQDKERGLPVVWVIHSNLEFRIGYVSYPPIHAVPIIVGSVSGAVLICILIVALCFLAQLYGSKREARLIQEDMTVLEEDLSDEIKQAFADLQTDLTDLTSDLEGIGMPFVSHREYASNMLFIGQERPDTEDKEYPDENIQKAMMKFSRLLSNKAFLIVLIQTLDAESNSKLPIRQKQLIASLLTVIMIMENKLTYLTDIMITLMTELIQTAAENGRTRQLFLRNESILDKLLSNWVALCLYDQLQHHTAYPLFVLYRAIKHRTESGPVDVFTSSSRYSLNFEKMLEEDIEFNTLTLNVSIYEEGTVIKEVKVLDVDTISQVKEKILDVINCNKPYSSRPSANQVSLEWRQGTSGRLVLTDMDPRPPTDKWRRINMLKDFQVRDNDQMTIVEKQDVDNATLSRPILKFSQGDEESAHTNVGLVGSASSNRYSKRRDTIVEIEPINGVKDWHLVKKEGSAYDDDDDDDEEGGRRKRRDCFTRLRSATFRNKITRRKIKEISFPRLMSTKGVIQKYVDDMFHTILSVEHAPKAIKYLFDFFDSQAIRQELEEEDPEITHIWKSNILPLRFWSNAIKNPDYIFDIRPTRSVGASMDVIGQLFHDVHDIKTHKLGQESSVNKLLYGREKQKYQYVVRDFYDGVRSLPQVPTQELNKELYKACENFTGLFSKLNTLEQLWDIVSKHNQTILDVLESEPEYEEAHLGYLLEEVHVTLSSDDDAV